MYYIRVFYLKNERLAHSLLVSDVGKPLRSLTKNEWYERIAQAPHQKWATMSNSLRSLTKNERLWANRSGRSPKMSESPVFLSESLIRSIFRINEQFAQKIDEQIPSPALQYTTYSTLYSLYSAHAAQVVLTSLIVYRNHCVSNLVLRPLMSGIVLNHFPLCFFVNMVPKIASQVSTQTCLWEVMGLSPEILPQLNTK